MLITVYLLNLLLISYVTTDNCKIFVYWGNKNDDKKYLREILCPKWVEIELTSEIILWKYLGRLCEVQ